MILLLFLVIVVLVGIGFIQRKSMEKSYPPGPSHWPFMGNVNELRALTKEYGSQHKALTALSKRFDSPIIKLQVGSTTTIVVSGCECVHTVLNTEEYNGRPWNFFISLRNMGIRKGITMNDGPVWQEMRFWFLRNIKSLGFARKEMWELIRDELSGVVQGINRGGVRQMKTIMLPVIINILWTFATGKKFNQKRLVHFINLLDRRSHAFDMTGGILSAYPWLRFIAPDYTGYNVLVTINNEFKTVLMEEIEEHKKNFVAGNEADLIDKFLTEMYLGKGPSGGFDDEQLMVLLIDVLLAGLNITNKTLELLFMNALVNQDVQQKIHEEIDHTIGREKIPDYNDKSKMPYTAAVILESQRIAPVVPILGPRRVMRDTKLKGYDIPEGSTVLVNVDSINSDPNLYPEPESFKPERFLKDGVVIQDENLLSFGKGKRQCPGIALANSSIFILFVGIMQRYKLLPVPGQEPPRLKIKPGLTCGAEPYEVLVVPRNE